MGQRRIHPLEGENDFYTFIRKADEEQIIAIIGRVIRLSLGAGCNEAEAKKAAEDVALQIGVLRGDVLVH